MEPTFDTPERLSSLEEIRSALEQLETEYILLAHQTDDGSARKIVENEEYFSGSGLDGTATISSSESIVSILPVLDNPIPSYEEGGRTLATHKMANALVVMVFPKEVNGERVRGTRGVDDVLIDLFAEKKIKQFGLPPQNIYGYYHNGELHLNPRFRPSFE